MWKILLTEFVGDLRHQKTRVLLTTFAVGWGTLAVVLLLAMGGGLRETMISGLVNTGDRMFMVWGGRTGMEYQGLPRGRQIRFTEADVELLRRGVPGVDAISPTYGRWGTRLRAGDRRTTAFMEGVYPAYGEMRRMAPQAGGRFLNERDLAERRRVVFLGDELAERLFGGRPAVGETVVLDGLPFTVVGVLEPKLQTAMNNGPDSDRAIIPASTFRALYGNRHLSSMLVRPRDVTRADVVKADLYRVLGQRHRFDAADQRALSIWDFIEDARVIGLVMLGIQLFLGLVGGMTLLVAGIGVANIMYVVVRERTREIGIKRALGARRRHITAQVMVESVLLALGGGLAGLAIASGLVLAVDAIPQKEGALAFLANPELSWWLAGGTVATLALIGLAAGFLPARRAAAMEPVESLRYE